MSQNANFVTAKNGDKRESLIRNIAYMDKKVVCGLEQTHQMVFTGLDYKKILTNAIQTVLIELRTETRQLGLEL